MSLVISAWEKAERENQELRAEIKRLQGKFDEATRLVGQSIQWQREAEAKIERLRAALLSAWCPAGGFNGMPADAEATVALCLKHGDCGCTFGSALEQK